MSGKRGNVGGVQVTLFFIATFYTEESHLHCSQFCLEVKRKVLEVWRLSDLGSVNTFTLDTQAGGSGSIYAIKAQGRRKLSAHL